MTKEAILKTLGRLEKELSKYKVRRIGLFGSTAREEHGKGSDIDILVDFNKDADLFDFSALALFLEEKFKKKVDVVPQSALRKELKSAVLREVIYL